mmetsp:Transcript_10630/g.31412  ORF Transcript_10630/g.31412 Transcript_10630/m.31412 type:complete len:281 (+) Transcript_10630:336-1178(+)
MCLDNIISFISKLRRELLEMPRITLLNPNSCGPHDVVHACQTSSRVLSNPPFFILRTFSPTLAFYEINCAICALPTATAVPKLFLETSVQLDFILQQSLSQVIPHFRLNRSLFAILNNSDCHRRAKVEHRFGNFLFILGGSLNLKIYIDWRRCIYYLRHNIVECDLSHIFAHDPGKLEPDQSVPVFGRIGRARVGKLLDLHPLSLPLFNLLEYHPQWLLKAQRQQLGEKRCVRPTMLGHPSRSPSGNRGSVEGKCISGRYQRCNYSNKLDISHGLRFQQG